MSESNTLRPDQKNLETELRREEVQVEPQAQVQMQARYAAGVVCPNCGAMNDADAQFCASCGASLRQQPCPNCGSPVDQDADFCEVCHHYIRQDVCSFCGAHLTDQDSFCPECGSPRGGIKCPTCNTMNEFSFCKQCGQPLTEDARALQHQMQQLPEYQQLRALAKEYDDLQMQLPFSSEQDQERDEASQRLRERILTLLAEDQGVKDFVAPAPTRKRCSLEELNLRKQMKMEQLAKMLDSLTVPPMPSPVKARNYVMAQKPAGVRLAWQCNYKNAMHSSPCGCAKPHLGGKWIVLGYHSNQVLKDDK